MCRGTQESNARAGNLNKKRRGTAALQNASASDAFKGGYVLESRSGLPL
jgi:hypothetical protein